MRVSTCFIALAFFTVELLWAGKGNAQQGIDEVKITLGLHNESLKDALSKVQKLSGFRLAFPSETVMQFDNLNLSKNTRTVQETLEIILKGTALGFKQVKTNIYIFKILKQKEIDNTEDDKENLLIFYDGIVRGKITGDKGEPLAGVSVFLMEANKGMYTNNDGDFIIRDVKPGRYKLQITSVGYEDKIVEINISEAQTTEVAVRLKEVVNSLGEVVVVGYGTQKKATLTGAIASVKGADLLKGASPNISNSLAGRLPGLIANNRTGEPGNDGSELLIRGKATFSASSSNAPLVVVDGIPDRGFSRINPNDIATITILKDASAAIYGVRAANGVILVTTKRGKNGKPTISYNGSYGIQQITRLPKLVEAWDYATYINEVNANSGTAPLYSVEDIQKFKTGNDPVNYPSTDWFKEITRKAAPQTDHSLSVSGGNEAVKYFFSGQYVDQESNLRNSPTNFKQYNVRSNIDVQLNKNLKINLDLAGRNEKRHYPLSTSANAFANAMTVYPTLPAFYPNGLPGGGIANGNNPVLLVSDVAGYRKQDNQTLNSKIGFDLKLPSILEGLYMSGYGAFDFTNQFQNQFTKPYDAYNYNKTDDKYINVRSQTGSITLSQDIQQTRSATYFLNIGLERRFGQHYVNGFIAYEQSDYKFQRTYAYRKNFLSEQINQLFAGDAAGQNNFGSANQTARQSYFGRLIYSFQEKYLAEFTLRHNGSFNFSPGKKWGDFPGLSIGWLISEEPFFSSKIKFVDQLKIRASWGLMGNDQINPFQYLARYNFVDAQNQADNLVFFGSDANLNRSLYLNVTPNPNVTWELQDTKNIGFDAELFKGKFSLTAEVFRYERRNILAKRNASVPLYTGLILPDENIGKVINRGVEVSTSYRNKVGQVSYNIGGNFSMAKNKIIFRDESPNIAPWQKSEGYAIDGWMVYKTNGIYHSQEEIDKAPHLPGTKPGDLWIEDVSGDDKISSNDQIRIPESPTPEITFGITMGASFKNFALDLLWSGQARAKQLILPSYQNSATTPPVWLFQDRWTPDNIEAKYPKSFDRNDTYNSVFADFWLRDASFLRLKSAEISYSFPKEIFSKSPIKNLRIYLSGFNLFSIDGLRKFNLDPEISTITTAYYPQTKIYRFGINIGL